ncbi:Fanconi anemia group J protein homolog [Hibiscus syriacus]|uniref:Fanconi anemia group J protein homolog n=1 Tax=Hibiscus syriacus TaxID=106335 RepID=UPI001921CFF0|nr:Fanconi anemia group J protein homolog [Hibiscus syriacus]
MSAAPGSGAIPSNNPSPKFNGFKDPKNVHPIAGIPVEFPYKPYGTQLSFMYRVISTLDRAQKDGHCHALLESPTGTGKSLSLLCSTLAWQQKCKADNNKSILSQSKPDPEATTDPLGHGGGFIPETQLSSVPLSSVSEPPEHSSNSKKKKKKLAPTIYYASRTHSQISQVIHEYRKTSYRVPMAILASRKHYCTNPQVSKENIDEECKLLLSNPEGGCSEFKNMHKVKCHPSLQRGGCHEAHDIEDLVKIGQVVKGCAYYAARSMADDAQLVFCPYSYIINPVIRGAMDVDIKGTIIVLDEAHNIEDIAREAGSVDLEEDALLKLQTELHQLKLINADIYQPLYEMSMNLLSWIEQTKSKLEETHESKNYFSSWTGDKALRQLQEANISQQFFPVLLECAIKAIKAASDTESEVLHLSGMSVITLEGMFSSLTYFFSRDGSHIFDYQLALQRHFKKDEKNAFGSWTCSLGLWCLNPSVVFRDITDLSLSVILTSGTLSPTNSFSSELGVQFGNYLEAPHVIGVKSQVWSAVISHGPGNCRLDASYKTADQCAFQDALGKSLEEIFTIVPGGCLIFFPSYKLMEKLCDRWRNTGQWSQLKARKALFVEPRGGNQEEFETVLKGYYDSVSQGKKPVLRRKRKTKKTDDYVSESVEVANIGGAAFLAVFRGKVSEGIDFSDDKARVVIAVGIPFPNINDKQIALKKKYNNTYRSSKNLLSGNEWYCQQAFRSLNQALGRCIRHRYDYGAIILLDWRFQDEKNRAYISKWLRPSIKMYGSFEKSLDELRSFFSEVKDLVAKNKELSSLAKYDITSPQLKPQSDVGAQPSMQADKDEKTCNECIDLECDSPKDSRCFEASSMTFANEDRDLLMVQETPFVNTGITLASPGSLTWDGSSGSTIIQASTKSPDQFLFNPMSTSLNELPSVCESETIFTPEKDADQNKAGVIPRKESPFNLSVCSYTQKRRKSVASTFINLVDEEESDTPAQIPGSLNSDGLANGDMLRRIEFGLETSSAENNYLESNVPRPLATDNTIFSCPVMDKRLQISCLLCRSPLGRPENNLYIRFSLIVSSKVYLLSLFKERLISCDSNTPPTVPVIITDISSVDPRLCNGTLEGDREQGIWHEEDGCVFKKVFCPFCSNPNNCLGVQIKAADENNVQLLNKIMLYHGSVVIRNSEAAQDRAAKDKVNCSSTKTAILNSIDKFAYSSQQSDLGGWRNTKSKLKLSKR